MEILIFKYIAQTKNICLDFEKRKQLKKNIICKLTSSQTRLVQSIFQFNR